jgi:hypothetical protein
MNPEVLRWWNLQESLTADQWEDEYQDQLFEAKKQLRQSFYTPKLFHSKLATYQKWASTMRPELKWVVHEKFHFQDFSEFENWTSSCLMKIERANDFESLVLAGHEVACGMDAYRDFVLALTNQWAGEEKEIEVTSREVFPSGAFLLGLRKGQTIMDWKMALLKERRRLSIVF